MFDFQKLEVYKKSKSFCVEITKAINDKNFDRISNDQLRRASFSIMLNIAEGSSRFSSRDRKNFLVIARGSVFECAAILEYLSEIGELSQTNYLDYSNRLDELSRMLFALIKKLQSE